MFASFNSGIKISAPLFEVWMGLLARIEGSVLWLSEVSEGTKFNLHQRAGARGVDPARLIFAPRIEQADHLARHRLADLFLDTLPCSVQAAASDALWAGLPVLTCRGSSFAGRVAASQLRSIGLSELVTSSLADYAALAQWLAEDRDILAEIKKRLAENRLTCPLFDTDLVRRNLEEAYTVMWARRQAGDKPASFACRGPCGGRRAAPCSEAGRAGECRAEPGRAGRASGDRTFARGCPCECLCAHKPPPLRTPGWPRVTARPRRRRTLKAEGGWRLHGGGERSNSIGTIGASLELRSVSEVLTLSTWGTAVSSVTKAWKLGRFGATHLRMKSISPDSIQHSRTSGCAAHEVLERLQVGLSLARQVHHREGRHLAAELLLVEQRAVALDVAGLLEGADPAQARRRRNADPPRQLHIGHAAILLKLAQDIGDRWHRGVAPIASPHQPARATRAEGLIEK